MSARDAILARLRTGTAGPAQRSAEAAALLHGVERPPVDPAHRVEAFIAALDGPTVSATCDRIATLAGLPGAVTAYFGEAGLPAALCLPPDPLLRACDWTGFALHDDPAPDEPAALAVALKGVAETGSLVFETGPHAPMLPNFLCLHLLVLLRTADIVAQLEDALPAGAPPRAHYWVTGVSGTTDIEGQYVRGAHGPRWLHVILLD